MTKALTTIERIRDKKIFNKYYDVVKNMSVEEFSTVLGKYDQELRKYYNLHQYLGATMCTFEMAVANLLADHENISVTRYKRLFA